MAFGFGHNDDLPSFQNAKALIVEYFENTKYRMTWSLEEDPIQIAQQGIWSRLVLNIVHVLSESLIRGGEIIIQSNDISHKNLTVCIKGSNIILQENFIEILLHKILLENITSRSIQLYLLGTLCTELHIVPHYTLDQEGAMKIVTLSFNPQV